MAKNREPVRKDQTPTDPGIRKGTVVLLTVVALAVGLVAGSIVGAIWQYRSGGGSKPEAAVEAPAAPAPSGPTPEQRVALQSMEARTQKDPNDVEAWIELGNVNYDLGRAPEAIRAYEKAITLKPPGSPDVLTDLGTMYRKVGQPQRAVELFREAHRLDPNHFHSVYNEGVVLLHDLNDVPGAARAWELFLRLVPQGEQSDRIRAMLDSLRAQGKLQ